MARGFDFVPSIVEVGRRRNLAFGPSISRYVRRLTIVVDESRVEGRSIEYIGEVEYSKAGLNGTSLPHVKSSHRRFALWLIPVSARHTREQERSLASHWSAERRRLSRRH